MKCFSRSIRSFASSSVLLLLWTAPLYGGSSTLLGASRDETGVSPEAVTRAIVEAVHARVGRSITVSVTNLIGVRLAREAASLVAVPDPSGRIGAPVRFVLSDGASGQGRARVGEATATVLVTAPAVRARRAIARGTRLEVEDVALLESDLSGRALRPLLSLEDTLGARAAHDIAEDFVVTYSDIVPAPLVKAGEIVRAHVQVGDVELVGSVVAAENGMKDEIIRVVNQESRYAFRARVIGTGEVEVVNVR
jgi:flagella basal body P-ring formation protein FlgA